MEVSSSNTSRITVFYYDKFLDSLNDKKIDSIKLTKNG